MSNSNRGSGGSALVAQPSGSSESSQKAADGDDATSNQNTESILLPVKEVASPSEAYVANADAHTEQPDPYKFRDLLAQEDMAYWAMWMFVAAAFTFIVTSIGTFLIWRQVRLTRRAVEDTSKATEAMREANKIAQSAQRPWVSIEIDVTEFQYYKEMLRLSYAVNFANIGKTIAENFLTMSHCHFVGDNQAEVVNGNFHVWREGQKSWGESSTLMPAEAIEHHGSKKAATGEIPWYGADGDRRFHLIICAAAYYSIPGETESDPKHFTERTFYIAMKNANPQKQRFIREARLSAINPGEAVTTQTYLCRTN